ncbi:hypothetical protein QYF61_005574 [Mycteria americana]|uniref:Reverse transcriptase domain-containing protein n=1 Tax=Mycteria americana TaxID=33587 RepID=A0AAN7RT24_MYCAM|nr:hypothetical protein QYF61_005574 [Mycteria americana]
MCMSKREHMRVQERMSKKTQVSEGNRGVLLNPSSEGRRLRENALEGKGAQDSWLVFKDNLLKAQQMSIPTCKKLSKCGRPLWMNRELVTKGKAVDVIYLDCNEAFDRVSHGILLARLVRYGLDEWTIGWMENWLDCWAKRVVISGITN